MLVIEPRVSCRAEKMLETRIRMHLMVSHSNLEDSKDEEEVS